MSTDQLLQKTIGAGWHVELFQNGPMGCSAVATRNVPVGKQLSHRRIQLDGSTPAEAIQRVYSKLQAENEL